MTETINEKKFKHRPWLHPFVREWMDKALRERVLRWQATTVGESQSHKFRGREYARYARSAAREYPHAVHPVSRTRQAEAVQKELCRRYAVVDAAMCPYPKKIWDGEGWTWEMPKDSQRAVDMFDRYIHVKLENGRLTATDTSCKITQTWNLDAAFPRTTSLTYTEAKAIVSFLHRKRASQLVDGKWVRGIPPRELPRKRAQLESLVPDDTIPDTVPVWKPVLVEGAKVCTDAKSAEAQLAAVREVMTEAAPFDSASEYRDEAYFAVAALLTAPSPGAGEKT